MSGNKPGGNTLTEIKPASQGATLWYLLLGGLALVALVVAVVVIHPQALEGWVKEAPPSHSEPVPTAPSAQETPAAGEAQSSAASQQAAPSPGASPASASPGEQATAAPAHTAIHHPHAHHHSTSLNAAATHRERHAIARARVAAPAEASAAPSERVSLADLDLATPAGTCKALIRIKRAADEVCPYQGERELDLWRVRQQCLQDSVARAVQATHSRRLADALHAKGSGGC